MDGAEVATASEQRQQRHAVVGQRLSGRLGLPPAAGFTRLDATWRLPEGGFKGWLDKLTPLPAPQAGYPDLPQWLDAGNDALIELDIAARRRPAARTEKTIGRLQAASADFQLRPLTSAQKCP